MNPTSTNIPMRALESAAKTQSQQCGKTGFHFAMPRRLCAGWLRLTLLLLFLALAATVQAQTTGDYRTAAGLTTANWNGTTTWETYNGSTWVATTANPSSTDGAITIRSGATVALTATVSIDQVTVDSGGQLTINSGIAVTLANGTGTDITVNGTFLNSGTVTWTGTMTVGATGTYIHNTTSSAANATAAATLDAASTWIYRGSSVLQAAVSISGKTYGNLTFESTSGVWAISAPSGSAALTINGNLSFGATGAGTATWTATAWTGALTIGGNLSVGTSSSLSIGANTVTLKGNLANSGTLSLNPSAGNFVFGGTTTLSGTAPTFGQGFSVGVGATATLGASVIVPSGKTATVNGRLNCIGGFAVTGAGNFILADHGTLSISSGSGLVTSPTTSGTIQVTGTRTFSSLANYVFSGTGNQAAGNAFPATVYSLTITNTGSGGNNTVTLGAATAITGPLQVNSGLLSLTGSSTAGTLSFDIGATAQAAGTYTSGTTPTKFAGAGSVVVAGSSIIVGAGTQYRSIAAGNLNSPATWEASNDGTTWTTMFGGITPGASFNGNLVTVQSPDTVILNANVTVGGLTINSGGTLQNQTVTSRTLTIAGNFANNGTIGFAGDSSPNTLLDFSANGSWTGSGDMSLAKTRVTVDTGVTLDISGLTTGIKFKSGSGTETFTVNGTLIAGTQVIDGNGGTAASFVLGANGTLATANVNGITNGTIGTIANFALPATPITLPATANYTFNGTAAQVTLGLPATVNNLTITNASGVTLSASTTVNGTLAFTSGNITVGANTLAMGGSSTALFSGGAAQVTTGLPATVNNLTINNASGVTLSASTTVTNTLTFTAGKITTGANTLGLGASATVSGAGSSAYVIGNLNKPFSTGSGQSFTFPVGSSSTYAPVSLANLNVGTAGSLTASSTGSEQPNIATSGIDFSKDVNRYWTLTAGGGLVASAYDATLNYVAGDIDGGATPANFIVQKYNAGWTTPTTSAANGTSATATGLSAFGDFAVGEPAGVAATQVLVETAADGSGSVVSAQNITAGSGITVYAITRAADNSFVGNIPSTWSLPTKTGGVVNGDLVPAGDSKSATFTGHLVGTATVRADFGGLTPTDSGLLTVVTGSATQVRVETASDGSGTVVTAQSLASGNTLTVYAITRDSQNNFLANAAADAWTTENETGGVTDSNLSPTAGTGSTFTGNLSGTGNIRASISGLTPVSSGLITVVASTLTWSAAPADYNWNNTSADWTGGAGIFNDNNPVVFNDAGSDTSPISLVGTLSPASVSVNASTKAYTFSGSGSINGTGTTLTKSGASTLTLQTANGYTGGTTISGGAINVQNNTALGTGNAAVTAGAGLQVQGGRSIANAVTLNGTGTNSDGALRSLSGANSLSTAVALGSSGVRINADAGSLTLDVAAGSAITGTAANLTFGGGGDVTVADPIATTSGTLTKDGSGRLTLSGANTFTGATTVSGGVLAIQNNIALGTTAGTTTVSSGAVEVSGGLTVAEPITLNGSGVSGGGALRNAGGNNLWTNTSANVITLAGATRINSDSGTLTIDTGTSSAITGSGMDFTVGGAGNTSIDGFNIGAASLTKDGAGTLFLTASDTFTGPINLNGGTLSFNSGTSRLGTGTLINYNGGALLWNGISTDLSGRTNNFDAGGGTLIIDTGSVGVTSGTNFTGSGTLTKKGVGDLKFVDPLSSRTGDTVLQEGSITVDQDGQFASTTGPLGTLYLDGGSFVQSASGRSFANAHGNPVIVRSNSVITTISSSTGTIDMYFTNDIFTSQQGGSITLSNGAGTGVLALRLYGQGFDFTGGITLRDDSGSGKGVGSLRSYNGSGAQTFSGVLTGGGTYRRNSNPAGPGLAGNTVFSGDNTYSGGATLVDGGLGFGISSTGSPTVTSGPLGTGALAVSPGTGTLPAIFASGGARTIGNSINITGNFAPLIINGANNLTLSGPINLGGNTDTIQVDNSAATEFSGIITNGGLTKTGSGTLKLSGADTYAGNTTISNGTLALGAGGSLPNTLTITLAGGTTFDVSASSFALGGSQTIYNNGTNAATITGSLDLSASASKAKFEATGGGSPAAGKLVVSGVLTLNGNILTVNVSGAPLTLGTNLRLIDAATVTGAAVAIPSLTGTTLPAGLTASVVTTPGVNGHVDLIVSCDGSLSGSAAADTAICIGDSYSLNGSATGGGGSYAYSWTSSPAGFTSAVANPSVSPTATTIYALTVTDGNGCTAPASVTVTVNPLPTTAAITGTNSVQQLATAAYSVANTAGSTYGWTVPAGASFTGGTGNSINVTFGSTSGNVSVIETNATGCTGTQQSFFVNVITCTSPIIVGGIDPTNVTATVGDQVVLTLTNVTGSSLVFQWQSNNVDIAGATYSSYTNASVTVADAGNYQVVVTNDCGAITSSFAVLTVNKQTPLIGTAPAATTNLIYGQALAGAGLTGGSVTNAAGATVAGSFDYSTPTAVPNAGTTSESVTFTPNDTNNYNNVSTTVSVTVNQAALGITANDDNKTYDGLGYSGGNGVTYAGFVNGDNAGSLGGGLSYGGTSQNATNAGSYSLVASGQSSANYAISYTNGTLIINARAASVTADAKTKTYGDVNPGLTAAVAGTVIGDTLNYALATDATPFSSVGTSNITVTLGGNPNYSVLATNSTLTIGARSASVTANNTSKNYGQTVTFAGTEFTTSGLTNGDSVTSVTLTSAGVISTAPVNTYAIVPSSAAGSGLGNYNLSYVSGTLTVNAATPVIINSPVQLVDGNFQLTFTGGDVGVSYQIQSSTDLSSPAWSVLATNVAATNGLPNFTDLDATNNPIRFYRTVVP